MNKYLNKFTSLYVQHRLYLFEKLITPILNFAQGTCIERVLLQCCKRLLGVKNVPKMTLYNGELRRMNCQYLRYYYFYN